MQPFLFLKPYIYAIGADFQGVCPEEVAFAGDVASIGQVEFIPVKRAHDITQRINISIGQFPARMRASGGTGKQAFPLKCKAQAFSIDVTLA
jgi:hypothetical protein